MLCYFSQTTFAQFACNLATRSANDKGDNSPDPSFDGSCEWSLRPMTWAQVVQSCRYGAVNQLVAAGFDKTNVMIQGGWATGGAHAVNHVCGPHCRRCA